MTVPFTISTKYGYLKPCPICGSHCQPGWRKREYHIHMTTFRNDGMTTRPVIIYCDCCRCSMSGTTLEDAISRWNDRRRYDQRR